MKNTDTFSACPRVSGNISHSGNEWKKILLFTVTVYIISVLIRLFLTSFDKQISVYPDEVRYLDIARSLAADGSILTRGASVDYQKILYSVMIMPAVCFQDGAVQMQIIGILNVAVVASAVFPAMLIAGRVFQKPACIYLTVLLTALLPDMTYSMTLMSENLYLPLSLWALYVFWRMFSDSTSGKQRLVFAALGGVLCYLLYLNKEVGILYGAAYLILSVVLVLRKRASVKDTLLNLAVYSALFFICFLLLKFTLFRNVGASYNQSDIGVLLHKYNLLYFFYSFFYHAVFALVGFFFFPVLYPLFKFKEMTSTEKKMYWLLILILILTLLIVSYSISIREDLGKISPRQHMRYYSPLFIPFFIIMLRLLSEPAETAPGFSNKFGKRAWFAAGVVGMAVLLLLARITDGSAVDQTMLRYFNWLSDRFSVTDSSAYQLRIDSGSLAVKAIIVALFTAGMIFLGKQRKKAAVAMVCIIVAVCLGNNCLCVRNFQLNYTADSEQKQEMRTLNDYLLQQSGNPNVLFISSDNYDSVQKTMDTYLTVPHQYGTYASYLQDAENSSEYINLSAVHIATNTFSGADPLKMFTGLTRVDYILVAKNAESLLQPDTVEKISMASGEYYTLYRNLDPTKIYINMKASA